jgi:hypothetical protein
MARAETSNAAGESDSETILSGNSFISPMVDFVLLFLVTFGGGLWLALFL